MQRAREQLLARAAFAEQQRGNVGGRDLFDHVTHTQHALACRDNAVERRVGREILQTPVLAFEFANIERAHYCHHAVAWRKRHS